MSDEWKVIPKGMVVEPVPGVWTFNLDALGNVWLWNREKNSVTAMMFGPDEFVLFQKAVAGMRTAQIAALAEIAADKDGAA